MEDSIRVSCGATTMSDLGTTRKRKGESEIDSVVPG